jgi:hypothetical protein
MWLQGVFKWAEGRPAPGKGATLLYNRDASELRHRKELVLHMGVNGWDAAEKEVLAMSKVDTAAAESAGCSRGDWYMARSVIPERARTVDFVISDRERQVGCETNRA